MMNEVVYRPIIRHFWYDTCLLKGNNIYNNLSVGLFYYKPLFVVVANNVKKK